MPRASGGKRERELPPEVWSRSGLIGDMILRLVEKGAYVGVSFNFTLGVNLTVMYENQKERFYCESPEDWDQLYKECETWVLEQAGTRPSKGQGKKPKGT